MGTKPTLDELWTTSHIARKLGITRQGAGQLAASQTDFPQPIGKLGHYTLWWRPEIEAWIDERHRNVKAGTKSRVTKSRRMMPRKATTASST